jgi:transposase
MTSKDRVDLSGMDRSFFEALSPEARVELLCRLHALAVEQAEKLAQDSTNSSRPPSCDGPFGPASGAPAGKAPSSNLPSAAPSHSGRKPGKQRGSKGIWRCEALEAERSENHDPRSCAACGPPFEMWDRQTAHSAHFVFDLESTAGGIRIACVLHRYHASACICGVWTAARPGVGALSAVPGRSRDLLLSEAGLVGPAHLHRRPVGALSRVACQDP